MHVPADPPELATWRALIERRDALVAKVRFGEEAAANAKFHVDLMRAAYGDELSAARYAADEAELRDSFERHGVEARHELKLLDDAIDARPDRGGPVPKGLLDGLRRPMVLEAVGAVKAYIAGPSATTEACAWLRLCCVAGRIIPDSEFASLIAAAKAWRAQNLERSGTMVAPYVVNSVAGRQPTARLTRT